MEFIVNDKGTLIKIEGTTDSKVVLPDNALRIGKGLFANNKEVEEVIVSSSTEFIGEQCFMSCSNLRYIDFNNTVKILKDAFKNCSSLVSVNLPTSLTSIGEDTFFGCSNLDNVVIPSSIKKIEKGTFYGCESLKEIKFNDGLDVIGESAFNGCKSLRTIELPFTLTEIGERSFSNCTSLETIRFSPQLRAIEKNAFYNCSSLKEVELPSSLLTIKAGAFERCFNLETITLPNSLVEIEAGAFLACNNLQKIVINNYSNISTGGLASLGGYTYYLDKQTGQIVMARDIVLNEDRYSKLDYEFISKNYGVLSKYNAVIGALMFTKEELETKEIRSISYLLKNLVKEDINIDNYKKISSSLFNSKEFVNLVNHIDKELDTYDERYAVTDQLRIMNKEYKSYDIFKLAYSLGAFNESKAERQKACEFIKNLFDKKILTGQNMRSILSEFKFKEYNKEWAEFLMSKDNFVSLLNENPSLISKISNNFEEIREFGRSNKGDQHYRKVTFSMCLEYCKRADFDGVNINNKDVAKVISKYTRSQDTFDDASKIRDEYLRLRKEGKIEDHILGREFKESDVFSLIEEERKKILSDIGETLTNLNKVSNNRFTFEFLSKYDPDNFVLGKYCSCCAHLEAQGYGVTKASILHPDCQNLVIRDEKGRIVAKSTLYINREQGYGVFNNIEINQSISKEDKMKIYEKYMKAVRAFALEYNKRNPNNPLMQINVGMGNNKLADILIEKNENAEVLLEGLNFTPYGKVNQMHSGDWLHEQRVLWVNENIKEKGGNNNGR